MVPFIAVSLVLTVFFTSLMERVHRLSAWESPMPDGRSPWVRAGYVSIAAVDGMALAVALVWSLAGLLLLVVSNLPERLVAIRAPDGYARWA